MKIVLAGGSGLIGQKVTEVLQEAGHQVVILTRKNVMDDQHVEWLSEGLLPEDAIGYADAFINLAGVSINDGRWSENHQRLIYESRMTATDELLRIIRALPKAPSILINASAIGIYPADKHKLYNEQSNEVASDFLGKTVHDWEQKALSAEKDGLRVVCTRFGVVLSLDGGAFPLMALPYKLFAGGTVGTGKQWVSWVHINDVARAILFAIENRNLSGPVNVTAPSPKRMKEFGQTIGAVLRRPHWIPMPSFAMKLALGKKSALVLTGQHVKPEKLLENDFEFSFPTLESALENLLTKNV
ncbi:TIGR01777 family oxidoreductase [Sporosarcina sp. 6E9]|uniref:TIGR01777 family oxidoreductase n=1 Tax=Sporosarcina sp. 6E9 TaxID=2819235 RepID=UPI001B311B03|nr:TIGR01777 family oxidoreductase [Sporosarcina sp. 6E9]